MQTIWGSYIRVIACCMVVFCSIVLTPSYYHLWFLYALISVYFVIPILRKVVVSASSEILIYYCVLWFVAVALVPLVERVTGIESRIDLNSISGYSGHLVFLGGVRQ